MGYSENEIKSAKLTLTTPPPPPHTHLYTYAPPFQKAWIRPEPLPSSKTFIYQTTIVRLSHCWLPFGLNFAIVYDYLHNFPAHATIIVSE